MKPRSIRRAVNELLVGRRDHVLLEGDCLRLLYHVPDQAVDLVLSDLPYGITDCDWDEVLPFAVLWWHYRRLVKPAAPIVLTCSQPFTTDLGASARDWLRYEWIWDKVNRSTGFPNANRRPLKAHENVLVFYRRQPTYNPQKTSGARPYRSVHRADGKAWVGMNSHLGDHVTVNQGERFPTSILRVKADVPDGRGLHPTQKPLELMEYFVRTYTNPGDLVLDNCMGSGTTGVACLRTGRRFLGIERDAEHFRTAARRVRSEARALRRPRRRGETP